MTRTIECFNHTMIDKQHSKEEETSRRYKCIFSIFPLLLIVYRRGIFVISSGHQEDGCSLLFVHTEQQRQHSISMFQQEQGDTKKTISSFSFQYTTTLKEKEEMTSFFAVICCSMFDGFIVKSLHLPSSCNGFTMRCTEKHFCILRT